MDGIFDSHAHYDDEKFDFDRELLLDALPVGGVCGVVNCGTTLSSSRFSMRLAEKYGYFYFAAGIHPHTALEFVPDTVGELKKLAAHEKCVAIGEIGLDYHYDFSPRDVQRDVLSQQLALARELDMPVIIHDREAHADVLELLRKYRPKGVVHCFSGSVEGAREVLSLDMYIGLGGAVTFKNARVPLEVAKYVPLDRLLLETDCPYMTPVPYRGKRCDSTMIPRSAAVIAEVRGIGIGEVLFAAKENAAGLFGIPC